MARRKVRRKPYQRRRWSFEELNTGIGPTAQHMMAYRRRAAHIDEQFHNKFPQRFLNTPPGVAENKKLLEAQEKLAKIKEQTPQAICITLVTNFKRTVHLFMNQQKTQAVLVEQHFVLDCVRRSIVYNGREKAFNAFKGDKVTWVERI